MSIQILFRACIELLSKQPKGSKIKTSQGEVDTQQALSELQKIASWCFPGLFGEQFEKVVHCRNCKNYKRYHKKGAPKKVYKMLCSIDKSPREPWFFCADAKERSAEDE